MTVVYSYAVKLLDIVSLLVSMCAVQYSSSNGKYKIRCPLCIRLYDFHFISATSESRQESLLGTSVSIMSRENRNERES